MSEKSQTKFVVLLIATDEFEVSEIVAADLSLGEGPGAAAGAPVLADGAKVVADLTDRKPSIQSAARCVSKFSTDVLDQAGPAPARSITIVVCKFVWELRRR